MYHYVYYSYEEWGRGYIGVRSCQCDPKEDCRYFGSFFDRTFAPTEKIILAQFESREEALQAEIDLHLFYQVHKNSHFANKASATSKKFYNGGHSPETRAKIGAGNRGKRRSEKLKEYWSKRAKNRPKKPFTDQHRANMSLAKTGDRSPIKGRKWWNNGITEALEFKAPGVDWVRGRLVR